MRVVSCTSEAIAFALRECPADISAVRLRRCGYADVPGTYDATARVVTFPTPPAARGVWRLQLSGDCGCYETDIFVDVCQAPAMLSAQTPTAEPGATIVCCETGA